jgi:hypothetical protein
VCRSLNLGVRSLSSGVRIGVFGCAGLSSMQSMVYVTLAGNIMASGATPTVC